MDHEKIKRLRKERGLTQEQARIAAGLNSLNHWSNIERGHQKADSISVDLLERIAAALGVAPADLINPPAKPRPRKP